MRERRLPHFHLEEQMRSGNVETLLVVRVNDKTITEMSQILKQYASAQAPLYRVADTWLFIEGSIVEEKSHLLMDQTFMNSAPFAHIQCDLVFSSRISFRMTSSTAIHSNIPFYKGELAMVVSDFSSFTEKMRDIPIWNREVKEFLASFNTARSGDFTHTRQIWPIPTTYRTDLFHRSNRAKAPSKKDGFGW